MSEEFESISADALPERESARESAGVRPAAETEGSRGEDGGEVGQAELIASGTAAEPLAAGTAAAADDDDGFMLRAARPGVLTVIGADDRVRITDTDKYPWRMIAALRLFPRPPLTSQYIGTGWLIGRRTLLTAGHCVYSDSDYGGWIGRIEVSPGRNGGAFPFATVQARKFSTLAKWKATGDPDYDVGCIHLEEPIGDRTGWFKIASSSDAELAGRLLNVSGYPGDRGNGTEQYHHRNRVLHPAARRIYYDIDTFGGQSGSPVWMQDGAQGEPVAVGIHAYGVGGTPSSLGITANSAPRLIPSLVATIRRWLADDDR